MSDRHPCPPRAEASEREEGFHPSSLEQQLETLDNHDAALMVVWGNDGICDLFVRPGVSPQEAAVLLANLTRRLVADYTTYTRSN